MSERPEAESTIARPVRRRPRPDMRFYRTVVSRVLDVGPMLRRVTLVGSDLVGFRGDGPDQRIKLLLPQPGQTEPIVPGPDDVHAWYPVWRAMPHDVRPILRTYTIRRVRPDLGEVDIDFVLHGDTGPGSAWAMRARPGLPVVFHGPWADYEPPEHASWQLVAGDATALPAIGAILEAMPPGTPARVFIENAECHGYDLIGGVAITWLTPGESLAEAIRSADLPSGRPYVWIGGEAGSVRDVRRHLIRERGVDRSDLYFCGYWRRGASEDDARA